MSKIIKVWDGSTWQTVGTAAPGLPLQSGNSGKYLTTNGSALSWATIAQPSEATPTVLGTVYGRTTGSAANVSLGVFSLQSLTTGQYNTAVGQSALTSNTSGSSNTVIGFGALAETNVSNNVAIGDRAYSYGTGNSNVVIGALALNGAYFGIPTTSGSNNIVIGYQAYSSTTSVSNEITLGNSSINRFRIPGLGIDFDKNIEIMSYMGAI